MRRSAERAIFVQLSHDEFELVTAALPGEQLIHLPNSECPIEVDVHPGDVLFSTAMGGAHVRRLAEAGVAWIHVAGTGIDHFPVHDAVGCTITCSRGASAVPIAEYVLTTMLAFEKDLPDAWVTAPPTHWGLGRRLGTLAGRTLGLVGIGAIGRAVARRALAFDMRVVACRADPTAPGPNGVEVLPFDEVVGAADHLAVAAPNTEATRRLIDRRALALARPGLHFVNVSRGTIVDHDALLDAIDAGVVARASLDVTDPEPLPHGHPLYAHPSVRITPHISWSAPGIEGNWVAAFVANLARYRAGEPLADVVDVERGY